MSVALEGDSRLLNDLKALRRFHSVGRNEKDKPQKGRKYGLRYDLQLLETSRGKHFQKKHLKVIFCV
jgi:hypothetical protein